MTSCCIRKHCAGTTNSWISNFITAERFQYFRSHWFGHHTGKSLFSKGTLHMLQIEYQSMIWLTGRAFFFCCICLCNDLTASDIMASTSALRVNASKEMASAFRFKTSEASTWSTLLSIICGGGRSHSKARDRHFVDSLYKKCHLIFTYMYVYIYICVHSWRVHDSSERCIRYDTRSNTFAHLVQHIHTSGPAHSHIWSKTFAQFAPPMVRHTVQHTRTFGGVM